LGKIIIGFNFLFVFFFTTAFSRRTETVYLNSSDTTNNMYIAVLPEGKPITAFLVLMDGFGVSPRDVLVQTKLPMAAAQRGILTIIPMLFTGPRYFGVDKGSQQSLKSIIEKVALKYQLKGMPLYLGGFSWRELRGEICRARGQRAMINELQRLGNKKAVLVTTIDKGYREPGHIRQPHSWSIAEPTAVLQWLLAQ
jgi:hypothetical protein